MVKSCPYCRRSAVKFSNEHIVSKSVLKEAFGDPIKSISSGSLLGGKTLIDVEPTTKAYAATAILTCLHMTLMQRHSLEKFLPILL